MLRALALTLLLALPSSAGAQTHSVDNACLASVLEERGFVPPEQFKALVGVIGSTEGGAVTTEWFDWRGTSDDREDWWPASSVKLYAAIAALERSRALGFPPSTVLTYHYDGEGEEPVRMPLSSVVRQAIVPSNNQAFNRLVEFVGFDELNRGFFTEDNGLGSTVFLRSYSGRIRHPETGHGINRHSPRITLEHRGRNQELPARHGRGQFECPDQGNCTTLRDLAESLRRVMLHEQLPEETRFDLGRPELALLRRSLEAPRREHGMLLLQAVQAGFGPNVPLRFFHKPGYAYEWSSEVLFIHRTDTDQKWVLAAAAHSGRRVLDDALTHIGAILASGRLRPPRPD